MDDISFSFIMPVYKSIFLKDAIESILNQSYKNFEIVIVNDASPYNIYDIVCTFHDSRIVYKENNHNIGGKDLVANWNHCIRNATNDYIILASDDDTYESSFLEGAVSLIKKYPNINILRSGVKLINESGIITDYEFPLKELLSCKEFTYFWAKGGLHSCVSNYIFRKESLFDNKGFVNFPKAHYSDDATALTISRNGIICIPNPNFNFRISSISLSYSSNYNNTISQIKATNDFMTWYKNHLNIIYCHDSVNIFKNASQVLYKKRYISMLEILISKIPILKVLTTIRLIMNCEHLYKKEKIKLFANYILNKL